ncbi:Protein F48E3.9 [Aphelenchoides avenae]|nr:Protein F48E3.9 [Aphelenchus avenae]
MPSAPIRRSGSVGNVSSATRRIPLVPQQSTTSRFSSASTTNGNIEAPVICNCQHPADLAFLENVYVQNLQTQIEVLELENAYLRGMPSTASAAARRASHGDATSSSSVTAERRGSQLGTQEWESAAVPSTSAQSTRKRVEFADSVEQSRRRSSLQQQLSRSQREEHVEERRDDELFLKLEEAMEREHRLEEQLRSQKSENRRLSTERDNLERRLSVIEGSITKETRQLTEDNIELQRRLDELTPLLAQKEAQIARLEGEKETLDTRLRTANLQVSSLQSRVEEKSREGSFASERETDRRREADRLRDTIRQLEGDIAELKIKEAELIDEMTEVRRQLSEEQFASKRAKEANTKHSEENASLAKENSRLSAELNRLEHTMEQQQRELSSARRAQTSSMEVHDLRRREQELRQELERAEERVRVEQETVRVLEEHIRESESQGSRDRDAHSRTQKELEALQALSASLTNENKGLREEKATLQERIEQLQKRLSTKEKDIRILSEHLEDFKRRYKETADALDLEIARHSEVSKELEEIVRKVHQLAESVPRHTPSPAVTTRRSQPTPPARRLSQPATLSHANGTETRSSAGSFDTASTSRVLEEEVRATSTEQAVTTPPPTLEIQQAGSHSAQQSSTYSEQRTMRRSTITRSIVEAEVHSVANGDNRPSSIDRSPEALAARYRRKLS